MSIRNLDRIFHPRSIAVIGASDDPAKVGYTVLSNLRNAGFPGPIWPVNSHRDEVQGLPAFPRVDALPAPADLAVICTPGPSVPEIVDQCGDAGILGLVILSAGFRESGEAGKELESNLRKAWKRHDGMRIIGPNCLGVMSPSARLNASFAADSPQPGSIALVSQSGALCTSLLDWATQNRIGFSRFVSVGNMLDVNFGDLIDYFGADTDTRSMILYVESVANARSFMSAARAFTRTKPVVAYKAGRFAASAKAAASHTGSMAGEDSVCDAAFRRAGIERVYQIDDMFDTAELLARHPAPCGERLAIITNAGGPGVMATDWLIAQNGKLATLSETTIQELNSFLPNSWSHSNPVDVLGDATPERFAEAVKCVLADKGIDAALVILTPQAMTDPTATARQLAEAAARVSKTILAAWLGGERVRAGRQILAEAGIPTYATPEHAVSAFMHLVSYARNMATLQETPREVPLEFTLDKNPFRAQWADVLARSHEFVSEGDSKSLLGAYGIPVARVLAAASANEAVIHARDLGYPVALKVLSPQITHKTDVGGVALGLQTDDGVRIAFERVTNAAAKARPDARIDGATVQRMVEGQDGVELILGAKKDTTFGSVIMVGAGGITAELYRDRSLLIPPLNERQARRALERLRIWPLLQGYRGRPALDIEKLIEVLMRFSYLIAEHPEIGELDVNPLLVTPREVIALDARVVIDHEALGKKLPPYSHLVIRPYPKEFVSRMQLRDGTAITVRPIGPEDEARWHRMLAACSAESLHSRFQQLIKTPTHATASRYCCIDYDREMALVVQIDDTGEIAAIGRLVADPDHDSAEFAILVADAWQRIGLGELLTNRCLDVAQTWGVHQVYATTSPGNARMLKIFDKLGFTTEIDWNSKNATANMILAGSTGE